MKVFLGFDDTDTLGAPYGTGKLVRWFAKELPEGCVYMGVVRQQLLLHDDIAFTSHNSSACMMVNMDDPGCLSALIEKAVRHILSHAQTGSDPGLCVATEESPTLKVLSFFGNLCCQQVMTQSEAMRAAQGAHLSAHGGTNDGIIGAAAAVGLTSAGWCGRFIDWGTLRQFPLRTRVADLRNVAVEVVSVDRDACRPAPNDVVLTNDWLRPRLLGHRPVLLVRTDGNGGWVNIDRKRKRETGNVTQACKEKVCP